MGFLAVNGGPGGETRGVATALLPGLLGRHFFPAADEEGIPGEGAAVAPQKLDGGKGLG